MTLRAKVVILVAVAVALASPVLAQKFSREQEIGELRLGQRVLVDDGTCPAGEIKEISGTKLSEAGVIRLARCIPRASGSRRQ